MRCHNRVRFLLLVIVGVYQFAHGWFPTVSAGAEPPEPAVEEGTSESQPAPPASSVPDVAIPVPQPVPTGEDWANAYLNDDPLAAKTGITYEDLQQALQDPQRRESALPRHFTRATGLTAEERETLLREAMTNESPVVRRQAAVELHRLGLLEKVVGEILLELARSDDPDLSHTAVMALERFQLAQLPEDYWRRLIEALGAEEFELGDAAERQLRDLGPAAVPVLLEAIRSDNPAIRQRAVQILGDVAGSKQRRFAPTVGAPAMAAPESEVGEWTPAPAEPAPRLAPPVPPPKGPEAAVTGHRERQVDKTEPTPVRVYFGTNREMLPPLVPRLWPKAVVFAGLVIGLLGYVVRVYRRKKRERSTGQDEQPTSTGRPGRRFSVASIVLLLALTVWSGMELNTAVQQAYALGIGPKFGPRRSQQGVIYYGHCEVTLPPTHKLGEVERPKVGAEDEAKHVVLQRTTVLEREAFYEAVKQELASREVDARDCFIFVHGFNVSFEEAARRTAQIDHDLQFPGVPLFYSWPSRGGLRHYPSDRNEIGYSKEPIKQFLVDVADNIKARRIHVIGHSMGGAAVSQAIAEIERDDLVFDQIVLAAPDIDTDVFREQLLPKLARHGRRTTLYCSKNDLALRVSYAFNDMYRAGDSTRGPIVAKDLDTVDASEIDTDLLGHSYYGDAVRLLKDVALIMKQNLPPTAPDRRLRAMAALGPVYWVFGD